MARLALRYNAHVAENGDVVKLIKQCDTNEDKDLDVSEIAELLVVGIPSKPRYDRDSGCDCHSEAGKAEEITLTTIDLRAFIQGMHYDD